MRREQEAWRVQLMELVQATLAAKTVGEVPAVAQGNAEGSGKVNLKGGEHRERKHTHKRSK
eukprot:4633679-Pleurochrysis_carterae.AAC.1